MFLGVAVWPSGARTGPGTKRSWVQILVQVVTKRRSSLRQNLFSILIFVVVAAVENLECKTSSPKAKQTLHGCREKQLRYLTAE